MPKLVARALHLYRTARLMQKLGHLTRAAELFQESAGLFLRAGSDGWLQAARVYLELGSQALADCNYALAAHSAQLAADILAKNSPAPAGPDIDEVQFQTWSLLGNISLQKADYKQAEAWLLSALTCALERFPQTVQITAGARNQLGMLYKYIAKFESAEQLYRAALADLLPLTGQDHPLVAALYHNQGGLAHARRDYQAGEGPARTAWQIDQRLFGADHPTSLADAAAYAAILDGLTRHDESEAIQRHVLEMVEKIYRPGHIEIANALNNLGGVCAAKGKNEEAQMLFRQALDLKERLLGPDHPETALTAANLGILLGSQGRQADGRRLIGQALICFETHLGHDHPWTGLARDNLTKITQKDDI